MTRIKILPQGSTLTGTVTYADTAASVSLFSNEAQTVALAQPVTASGALDIWFTPTQNGRAVTVAFANSAGTSALNVTRPFVSSDVVHLEPSTTSLGLAVPSSIAPVGVQTPSLVRQAFGDTPIDQTATIQAAIDAAWTAGGGQVWLPAGLIYVTNLKMRPDVDLIGKGWQTVLRAMPNQSAHIVDYSVHNAYHCVLRDLRVDGNAANGATGRCLHMDTNPSSNQNFIFNNAGVGPLDPAMNDNGMSYAQVPRWQDSANSLERLLITNSGADWAVFLGTNNRGDWLTNLFVFQCVNGAIQNNATDTQAVNVQAGACGDGILITGVAQAWTNCKSWYHGISGVHTGTGDGWRVTLLATTGLSATRLTGCESQDNNRYGLNLDLAGSTLVSNFVSGGDSGAAVRLGNAQNCDISFHIASADRAQNTVGMILDGAGGIPLGNTIRWTIDQTQFPGTGLGYSTSGGATAYGNNIEGPNQQNGLSLIAASTATITPTTAKTAYSCAWGSNLTINAYNGQGQIPGERLLFQLFDTAGGHSVTWNAAYRGAPAVTTTASKLTTVEFLYFGSGVWGCIGSSVNA